MNLKHFSARPLRRANQGFTLIELMVVVIIVAILTSIAIPSYRDHVVKSNRAAAESFMLQLANKEEQYLLDARNYTGTLGTGGLNLSTPADIQGKYTVTIGNISNTTYTITAVPTAAQKDPLCGTLTLNQAGLKTPTTGGCW